MDRDEAMSVLALAQQAGPELLGPAATEWRDQLERERDRLHAALGWFVGQGMGGEALALVAAIWRMWLSRGEYQGGCEWLETALNAPGAAAPSGDRARALNGAGLLTFRQGENERSRRLNEESLAVARAVGDRAAMVDALVGLARVALRAGDYAAVRARCEEGMSIARELGGRRAEAPPLHLLAAVTRLEGDYDRARRLYLASIALNSDLGDRRMVAMERVNLGAVEALAGNPTGAEPHLRDGLRAVREQGDWGLILVGLIGLARVAAARGDVARAARLLGAAETALERAGTALDPDDQPLYDAAVERARAVMGETAYDGAREEGRSMTLEAASAYALGETA